MNVESLLPRLLALDLKLLLDVARPIPVPAAAALALAGILFAALGSHRWLFRLLATCLGGGLGYGLGQHLAPMVALEPQLAGLGAAGLLALTAAISPPVMAFAAFGTIGGLVGAKLAPEGEPIFGILPGAVLLGGGAVVLFHVLASVASALAGGLLFSVGLTAGLLGTGLAGTAEFYPWMPLVAGAVLAIAGAAFQLTRPEPEEREKQLKEEKREKKQKKERKEQEKSWEKYTKATTSNTE